MAKSVKTIKPPAGWASWGDYVLELATAAEKRYAPRNKEIAAIHDRRFMKKSPQFPENFKVLSAEFRSPLIWDFIRRSVAIVSTQLPQPKVIPAKAGPEAQKNSSLREKWQSAALRRMTEKTDAYPMFVDAGIETGSGILKVIPQHMSYYNVQKGDNESDDDYDSRKDVHRKAHFPFIWEHVPTACYYPMGENEVVEVSLRETLPLSRKYGLNPKDIKVAGYADESYPNSVRFIEYWKAAEEDAKGKLQDGIFVYMVEDTVVKVGRHQWTRVPYFCANANTSSSKDIAEQSLSLAYPLANLQDNIDALATMSLNWVYIGTTPMINLTAADEGAIYNSDKPFEWEPGKGVPPGFEANWVTPTPMGADLSRMMNYLQSMANQVSLNPLLGNLETQGDLMGASGVTIQTMVAIAKSIFGPFTTNIARVFDEIAAFMFQCIEKDFKSPIPVYAYDKKGKKGDWLEIGPDDIHGYYEMRHSLHPVIPAEWMSKTIFLSDQAARGHVTKNYVREEGLQIDAPEEMADAVLLERFEEGAAMQSLLDQRFMEAMGAGQPPGLGAPMANMPIAPPQQQGVPAVEGVGRGLGPGSAPYQPQR